MVYFSSQLYHNPLSRLSWSSDAERRLKGILEMTDGVVVGLDRLIGDEVVGFGKKD